MSTNSIVTLSALTLFASTSLVQAQDPNCPGNAPLFFPDNLVDGELACNTAIALEVMGEPALPALANSDRRVWRFAVDGYLGLLRVVRVVEHSDGTGTAFYVQYSDSYQDALDEFRWWHDGCIEAAKGDPNYIFGNLSCADPEPEKPEPEFERQEYPLIAIDIERLAALEAKADICAPEGEPALGFDGVTWLLETAGQGHYCVTDRWTPQAVKGERDIVRFGNFMALLTLGDFAP